jgi:cell division protein FtsQ
MSGSVIFRRRLVVALVVTLVAGVAYAVYSLRIEQIRVTGLRTLDPKQVVERSGLRGGERILWVRLSAVVRRLEEIPAVASATAERSFPQTVVIHVRERTPIARLDAPEQLAVDGRGRLFSSSATGKLPVIEGIRGTVRAGAIVDREARTVLGAFSAFPDSLRTRTARIAVGPPVVLFLMDGTEVRFGSYADLDRKARVAEAILRAEAGQELAYVDVRSPSVPVSRKREPSTPTPTAGAPASPAAPTPAATAAP